MIAHPSQPRTSIEPLRKSGGDSAQERVPKQAKPLASKALTHLASSSVRRKMAQVWRDALRNHNAIRLHAIDLILLDDKALRIAPGLRSVQPVVQCRCNPRFQGSPNGAITDGSPFSVTRVGQTGLSAMYDGRHRTPIETPCRSRASGRRCYRWRGFEKKGECLTRGPEGSTRQPFTPIALRERLHIWRTRASVYSPSPSAELCVLLGAAKQREDGGGEIS